MTIALAACGQKKETQPDGASADLNANGAMEAQVPAVSLGQQFANSAAASDAFEIATSKLAQATSKSASVKAFASKMVDAHTQSTEKLKATAGGLSPPVIPDPTLTAEQQQIVDSLKMKTGADFDAAYIRAQVDGHQQTLDALKAYVASGDLPALKDLASSLVPTVTAHLNMAKGLKP